MSEDRAWIRIINKYARPCVDCGKLLPVGENCYWLKSNGIKCPDCYNNINENHKMDADAQKGEQDIDPLDEDNGGNIEVEEQDNRKEDKGIKNPYRKGTKNNFIAEQILEGKKGYEVFQENREKVGKEEPLIYRENIGDGKREPKNPYQQMDQFRKNIDSVENTIEKLKQEMRKIIILRRRMRTLTRRVFLIRSRGGKGRRSYTYT